MTHCGDSLCAAPLSLLLAVLPVSVAAAQPLPQPQPQARVIRVDGVAAVVGGGGDSGQKPQVILRSDVELRARIALAGHHSVGELPLGPLPEALLAATLREIIGEYLIEGEAGRVAVARPDQGAVREEVRRLARAAGGQARFSALLEAVSVEDDEIERIARRRALVAAFLRANLEGATVVTDAEVERAYAAAELSDLAPEVARARLRAQLAREALDRTIARWVSVLEERARVRVHAEYDQ